MFMDDSTPFYLARIIRKNKYNENALITKINQYCVYEAFQKIGWMYTAAFPQKPTTTFDSKLFIQTLTKKKNDTNDDKRKRLFSAMIEMILYIAKNKEKQFLCYGTDYFEKIWEAMIDIIFGVNNKDDYFPNTYWKIKYRDNIIPKHKLEPDTIMMINDKCFVLDAKYYRFGITGKDDNLPGSADINKQITYGEFVFNKVGYKNGSLFNAFLMPFNMKSNKFGTSEWCANVAEATADWRIYPYKNYERIQGIIIDTSFLIHNLFGNHEKMKEELASVIDESRLVN